MFITMEKMERTIKPIAFFFTLLSLTSCKPTPSVDLATSEVPVHIYMRNTGKDPLNQTANLYAESQFSSVYIEPPEELLLNGNAFKGISGVTWSLGDIQWVLSLDAASIAPGTEYLLAFNRVATDQSWTLPLVLPAIADINIIENDYPHIYETGETVKLQFPVDESLDSISLSFFAYYCNRELSPMYGGIITLLTPVDPKKDGKFISSYTPKFYPGNVGSYDMPLDFSQLFSQQQRDDIASLEFEEGNVDLYCKGRVTLHFEKKEQHPDYDVSFTYHDEAQIEFYFNVSSLR